MFLGPRKSLQELVHEIVDVTPLKVDLDNCPEANGYAFQIEKAVSRSRSERISQTVLQVK
jgi:hypothetical protein